MRLKDKTHELYDQMCEVFEKDIATEQYARRRRTCIDKDNFVSPSPSEVDLEGTGHEENIADSNLPSPTPLGTPSFEPNRDGNRMDSSSRYESSSTKKRVKSRSDWPDSLDVMASNLGRLAAALEQHNRSPGVDPTTLYAAVCSIPDIPETLISHAFEFLIENPVKAKTFMIYDNKNKFDFLMHYLDP